MGEKLMSEGAFVIVRWHFDGENRILTNVLSKTSEMGKKGWPGGQARHPQM